MREILRAIWSFLGPRGTAAVVIMALFTVILFQNTAEHVSLDLLFWDALTMSKVTFMAIALLGGFLAGVMGGWWLRGRVGRRGGQGGPPRP